MMGRRVMLAAIQEPRVDPRLPERSRLLAGVVIPAFPIALWTPTVGP